jgi:hypothetical protein
MYAQCEDGLVASGNAVRYEHPVHKDTNGEIVDDESLTMCVRKMYSFSMKPEIIHMAKKTGIKAVSGKSFREAKFQKSLLE